MNRRWLGIIFLISITLLSLLKAHEKAAIAPFYLPEKVIRVNKFDEAKGKVPKSDLEYVKLWESMLTGRAAPLSRFMKERYKLLGLNHLFTPSGFHLSAVLIPFMKIFKRPSFKLYALLAIGFGLLFLPGLGALKRMLLIKTHQHFLGLKAGFILALVADIFFGSFQTSALSFTYSFLFLGIIYSGARAFPLILLFFTGQMVLAMFQNTMMSPLILVFSPILNFFFGLLMPLLFFLSFPLWDWQLELGIMSLKALQAVVDVCAFLTSALPFLEVHIVTLFLVFLMFRRRWRWVLLLVILFSGSLNSDHARTPGIGRNDFVPQGRITKVKYSEKMVYVNFSDGNCRLKLVRGFWWENCSPRRRSRKKN